MDLETNELLQLARSSIQIVRRFKWLLIACFYASAWIALGHYKFLLFFVPFAFLSALAYAMDKEREMKGMDDFSGGWLFFRYGEEVDLMILPIPVKPEWSAEETSEAARSMQYDLARRLGERLPSGSAKINGDLSITDRQSGEKKTFLRLLIHSHFGSTLTHFVHYATLGQTVTAHYFTFIRGTLNDWQVVKFILESPFTIWFWGVPWLLNRYSVIAELSAFRTSSFDGIDLRTMYALTNQVVYEETAQILQEAGLLTDEIRETLHYHIKQTIRVSRSPGAQLSGLSLDATSPRMPQR